MISNPTLTTTLKIMAGTAIGASRNAKCTMPVMSWLTVSRPSSKRLRRSRGRLSPAAPTRIAKVINGSTSPSTLRWLPTNAPNRLRGMNMSTTAMGVIPGPALFSTCCTAWPPYSLMSRAVVSSSRRAPGSSRFIINRPSVAAMAMFAKNKAKVRPASGPRSRSSPSCTTP